ncbi:MAG: CRISPR-associated endonuclease Cas2 [Blastocatellia bacterium]|nr:CRISPR-associated endonuclease Cas2 [Blastocatellia bacterium]
MRSCYIVAYDISNQKRLRQVHRTLQGYGESLQYSVFLCLLSAKEKVLLLEALTSIINHKEDQVMFVNLGSTDGRISQSFETLGKPLTLKAERIAVIV